MPYNAVETSLEIGDSADFVRANLSDIVVDGKMVDRIDARFLGPDKDLCIKQVGHEYYSSNRINEWTNYIFPIFGDIFEVKVTYVDLEDGFRLAVAEFPSAPYINKVREEMGYRLGEDVLEFVRVCGVSEIPVALYTYYQSQGQFPQSDGPFVFNHDRDRDHAPGAAAFPPQGVRGLKHVAQNSGFRQKDIETAGKILDQSTALNRELAEAWESAHRDGRNTRGAVGNELRWENRYRRRDYRSLLQFDRNPLFWTYAQASAIAYEHFEDLATRVERYRRVHGIAEEAVLQELLSQ